MHPSGHSGKPKSSKACLLTYLGSAADPHSEKGSASWQHFFQQTWLSWLRSEGVCLRRRLACLCLCRRESRLASGWTLQGLHLISSDEQQGSLWSVLGSKFKVCARCVQT